MTDMNVDQGAIEQTQPAHGLDTTEQIHRFDRRALGPDELYELREELIEAGEQHLAIRVDIEYGNSLRYDDYEAKFTAPNLVTIVMILGSVRYNHVMTGNSRRSNVVDDLVETISTHFREWAEDHDVDLDAYLGIDLDDAESDGPNHSERMKREKHRRDSEDVSTDVEAGPLESDEDVEWADGDGPFDDVGPDAVEEERMKPSDSPDTPDGPSADGDDSEGA